MTADWSRPFWKQTERTASLFYFVPGEPPIAGLELSRSRHHVEGFPEDLQLSAHERSDDPEWFAGFFARPGLGFEIDEAFGDRADEVRAADRGTVVRLEIPDSPELGYLRDSVGVVSAVLDQGGLGVLDLSAARWWSREQWLSRFVDRSALAVGDFLRIISSDDEQLHPGIWIHTRGMRKFARPDLQVKHVPGPWAGDNPLLRIAGDLLNTLAERLCLGAVIADGEVIAFPGVRPRCTVLLTPDDSNSSACHFGNEVLEVVDLVGEKAGADLSWLLGHLADQRRRMT